MDKLRKDAMTGIVLLIAWVVIKFIFRGGGLFLWLLGAAGLVILVVGILPEDLHNKVIALKDKLFKKVG